MPPFVKTVLQAAIGIVVLGLLWAIAAPIAVSRGLAAFAAPSPGQVIPKAIELYASDFFRQHLLHSLTAFAQGILPAMLGGMLVGLAMRFSNVVRWLLGPLVIAVASSPVIALAPLFILWFGLLPEAKSALIILMVAFPVANTVMIVRAGGLVTDFDPAAHPPANRARGTLIAIMAAFRLGILLGVVALIASEFVGSKSGIGYFIAAASAQLDPISILAAFLILALPMILLLALLQGIEEQIAA